MLQGQLTSQKRCELFFYWTLRGEKDHFFKKGNCKKRLNIFFIPFTYFNPLVIIMTNLQLDCRVALKQTIH